MVYAQSLVYDTNPDQFARTLASVIEGWQSQSLRVEVQFSTVMRPSGTPFYSALVLAHKEDS